MSILAVDEYTSGREELPYFNVKNFKHPIVICGCHGGGTSFVTKILRHLGIFVGNDAGIIELRKFHESHIFRHTNENILRHLITPTPPKGMMTVKKTYWNSYFSSIQNTEKMQAIANSIDLNLIFKSYSPKTLSTSTKVNSKILPMYGWKDPRNSITLPIWKKLFPGLKILVVQSPHKPGPSHSLSGDWFKNKSDKETRDYYMKPAAIQKGDNYLYFDYQAGVKDLKKFNRLVTWLGLSALNQQQLDELLIKAGYEG